LSDNVVDETATLAEKPRRRSVAQRAFWVLGTSLALLFGWYLSMLLTSQELDYERRQSLVHAIAILQEKGFTKQAFVLSHMVNYRDTDSWWNRSIGHHDAYAATNFPFEIVTLYPEFFQDTTDDTERAAILLHESYHLLGAGEAAALEAVWRNKQRLGWTADRYGSSAVWINTRDTTMTLAPHLFRCGQDERSDCLP
jgi:hypothetical protein